MRNLIEQSRAYAKLGMWEEADAAAAEAVRAGYDDEILVPWLIRLAYKDGDWKTVKRLGCEWARRGKADANSRHYTALALHHLGESERAADLMLKIEEDSRESVESYVIACFLAVAGDCDEAVEHLLRSLPGQQNKRAKAWLDGDLKRLWERLARGAFKLETAHMLLEDEFDALRRWEPECDTEWELDFTNFGDLPGSLRKAVRFDPHEETYLLDGTKASPGSELAAQFESWARKEVLENQRNFDRARSVAWQKMLAAHPCK